MKITSTIWCNCEWGITHEQSMTCFAAAAFILYFKLKSYFFKIILIPDPEPYKIKTDQQHWFWQCFLFGIRSTGSDNASCLGPAALVLTMHLVWDPQHWFWQWEWFLFFIRNVPTGKCRSCPEGAKNFFGGWLVGCLTQKTRVFLR